MNPSDYKLQAERLREHLSSVHKIRLKASSCLEALAAIYGVRDWNTLRGSSQGTGSRELGDTTFSETGAIGVFPLAADKSFSGQHTLSDPEVCDAFRSQRIFVQGGGEREWLALLEPVLKRQIAQGGRLLLLDHQNGAWKSLVQKLAQTAPDLRPFYVLDPYAPTGLVGFNPLEGLSAESAKATLMAVFPNAEPSAGDDYFRDVNSRILSVLVDAMLAAGDPLTFEAVLEVLMRPSESLPRLQAAVAADPGISSELQVLVAPYRAREASGDYFDEVSWRKHTGGLAGRLFLLASGTFGKVFHRETPRSRWPDFLAPGPVVYWSLSDMGTEQVMEAVLHTAMAQALVEAPQPAAPLLVVVSGMSKRQRQLPHLLGALERCGHGCLVLGSSEDPAESFLPRSFSRGVLRIPFRQDQASVLAIQGSSEGSHLSVTIPQASRQRVMD